MAYDVISEAEVWLRETLRNDADILSIFGDRIYSYPGPRYNNENDRIVYPILTYEFQYPKPDLHVVGAVRFWSTIRFIVRGTMKGNDQKEVAEGAQYIYNALQGKYGYTDGAIISACIEDRPYKEVELLNSTQYIHLGGEYEININTI
jgi:hypothetical protein